MDVTNGSLAGQSSGEIQNCSSTMEYQQSSHVFSASFRNMQLKKIKRAEKKGTESVMDEKFALFFYATTTVNDYQIRVWTLSLPVVVIVHGNQEPQSWATITWDNAFADIVRDPFVVTDRVTWRQLSVALNTKFGSCTQRALTAENLEFLCGLNECQLFILSLNNTFISLSTQSRSCSVIILPASAMSIFHGINFVRSHCRIVLSLSGNGSLPL